MNKVIAIAALVLLVAGCSTTPTGPYQKGDVPPEYGGMGDIVPDWWRILVGSGPSGVYTRTVDIDGQQVADEFVFVDELWSERELANTIAPDGAAEYGKDGGYVEPCNPDLLVCKYVMVANPPGSILPYHMELRCSYAGCLTGPQ